MQEANNQSQTDAPKQAPASKDSGVVIRLPKLNMQVVILGLIAVITLFQTIQLFNISNKAGSVQVKTASAATLSDQGGVGGGNADIPQSMVGGC